MGLFTKCIVAFLGRYGDPHLLKLPDNNFLLRKRFRLNRTGNCPNEGLPFHTRIKILLGQPDRDIPKSDPPNVLLSALNPQPHYPVSAWIDRSDAKEYTGEMSFTVVERT